MPLEIFFSALGRSVEQQVQVQVQAEPVIAQAQGGKTQERSVVTRPLQEHAAEVDGMDKDHSEHSASMTVLLVLRMFPDAGCNIADATVDGSHDMEQDDSRPVAVFVIDNDTDSRPIS